MIMQYSKSNYLMWTNIEITIFSDSNSLDDIYDWFWIFYWLEKEFSRFIEDSDLSLLNKNRKLEVSDRFIDVIKKAISIYDDTNWFFNPLINLKKIWYSSDFKKWDFREENIAQNLDLYKLKIIWNTVILAENQNLDLWWIVKWYWVDLVVWFLKDLRYNNFIINAWWDIYISWNIDWKKSVVWIDNPFNTKLILATLELENKAISTSWTYKRKWDIDWKKYNHILNPETNTNNNEIISISLISENVHISDSYATACISMWIQKSLIFLEKQNIDWVIIWNDWNIYKTRWMNNYNLNII